MRFLQFGEDGRPRNAPVKVGGIDNVVDAVNRAGGYVQQAPPLRDSNCLVLWADEPGAVWVQVREIGELRGVPQMLAHNAATRLLQAMHVNHVLRNPQTALSAPEHTQLGYMVNGSFHEACEGLKLQQGLAAARRDLSEKAQAAATWQLLHRDAPEPVKNLVAAAYAMLRFLDHGWPSPEAQERMGTQPPPTDLP